MPLQGSLLRRFTTMGNTANVRQAMAKAYPWNKQTCSIHTKYQLWLLTNDLFILLQCGWHPNVIMSWRINMKKEEHKTQFSGCIVVWTFCTLSTVISVFSLWAVWTLHKNVQDNSGQIQFLKHQLQSVKSRLNSNNNDNIYKDQSKELLQFNIYKMHSNLNLEF